MKVQHKIILAFFVIAGLILLSSCILIFNVASFQREQDFHNRLRNRAATTASLFFTVREVDKALLQKVDSVTVNALYDQSIDIYDHNSNLVYKSSKGVMDSPLIDPLLLSKSMEGKTIFFNKGKTEGIALPYTGTSGTSVIVITAEDRDGKKMLHQLTLILLGSFCVGIILSALGGWIFSKTVIAPLKNISATVKSISAENFEERLPETSIPDEWNELTRTFNVLLNRLQESFEVQGRFIANASHELSTPLAAVNSQIDVALQQERAAHQYKQTLMSVKEDIVHLTQLTRNLLEIARTAKGGSIQTMNIRVDELLLDVSSALRKSSAAWHISIQVDELPDEESECTVVGNYDLLLSALKNLAENGCKYSPDHSVKISLSFVSGRIILLFRNRGRIDPGDISNLFQPFYRSNSVSMEKGYGMGLSLVKRIINLHRGAVKVENVGNEEVLFTVVIPSAV